jgi:hypothetical protein
VFNWSSYGSYEDREKREISRAFQEVASMSHGYSDIGAAFICVSTPQYTAGKYNHPAA